MARVRGREGDEGKGGQDMSEEKTGGKWLEKRKEKNKGEKKRGEKRKERRREEGEGVRERGEG